METHEVHLTAAVVDFVQELWVGGDVLLLQNREEKELKACLYYAGGEEEKYECEV